MNEEFCQQTFEFRIIFKDINETNLQYILTNGRQTDRKMSLTYWKTVL